MKKLFGFFALAAAGVLALSSCGKSNDESLKVGFIFLHDNSSSYDKNFMDAATDVCKELGVKAVMKSNVAEGTECQEVAEDLADSGCDIVFADSFGHEPYLLAAAKKYPDVQFCHATGTMAHTANQSNLHNAFASIYEGRYCTGIAAGMKLNEMINNGTITADQAVLGYVGAYTYAEVISGYTSFYLGAKSVCPSVTMKVKFTGSWYDLNEEKEVCNALISAGCKVISQHADSAGAPSACEEAGVPNVFYNGENKNLNTYLISSRIDWRPYFRYIINQVKDGKTILTDYVGDFTTGSVEVYAASSLAASGTQAAIDAAIASFKAGTLDVFDTTKFTVEGAHLTEYRADVNTDANYEKDTQVITNNVFKESFYRSAPYFDITIDGIELLNSKF